MKDEGYVDDREDTVQDLMDEVEDLREEILQLKRKLLQASDLAVALGLCFDTPHSRRAWMEK